MGMAPLNNPAVVIVVTINGAAKYGAVIAGPVFREVATTALRILDVPRDMPDVALPDADDSPEKTNDLAIAELGEQPVPAMLEPTLNEAASETRVLKPATMVEVNGSKVPNFQGKTITIIVGTVSGDLYDLYARALALFMGKYLAGNPNMIVQNMPGAGHMIAANYVYNKSKPDGLTLIGSIVPTLYFDQLVGRKEVQLDWRKLTWIGTPVQSEHLLYMRTDAPYKNIEDIRNAKEAPRCGATNPATTRRSVVFPDPERPSTHSVSPAGTSREISASTARPSRRTVTPSSWMAALTASSGGAARSRAGVRPRSSPPGRTRAPRPPAPARSPRA